MSKILAQTSNGEPTAIPRLVSMREVMRLTSLSRSTLYDLIRSQRFPSPIKATERRSAWVQSEIASWIDARVLARNVANKIRP